MRWLDEVLQSTAELESPREYFYWSLLAAISAVIKDNVYLSRGGAFNLYPNVYVILVGKSGVRKGLPVRLANNLVAAVGNTRLMVGRQTIQAVIQRLSQAWTKKDRTVVTDCAGFLCASELSSAIIGDPSALTILTDLYDRHWNKGEWTNTLKSGVEELKNPTLTLLGATNQAHFDDFVPEKDILGGFIGRTFMIPAVTKPKLNPLVDELAHPPDTEEFAKHLTAISKLTGPFTYKNGSGVVFADWYREYYAAAEEDETGTQLRVGDSVLKVAMLLSLAEGTELILRRENILEAIEQCESLVGAANQIIKPPQQSQTAPHIYRFISVMMSAPNHTVQRAEILRRNTSYFNASEMDEVIRTLEEANSIKIDRRGKHHYYTATPALEERWARAIKKKKKH